MKGKGSPESRYHGNLGLLKRFCLSALVTRYSLFPPCQENGGLATFVLTLSQFPHVAATKEEIRFYLGDLSRGVDRQGELRLLLPGCLPFAAPALLFRLKRMGFSDCRLLMTVEGMLLCARR